MKLIEFFLVYQPSVASIIWSGPARKGCGASKARQSGKVCRQGEARPGLAANWVVRWKPCRWLPPGPELLLSSLPRSQLRNFAEILHQSICSTDLCGPRPDQRGRPSQSQLRKFRSLLQEISPGFDLLALIYLQVIHSQGGHEPLTRRMSGTNIDMSIRERSCRDCNIVINGSEIYYLLPMRGDMSDPNSRRWWIFTAFCCSKEQECTKKTLWTLKNALNIFVYCYKMYFFENFQRVSLDCLFCTFCKLAHNVF